MTTERLIKSKYFYTYRYQFRLANIFGKLLDQH